MLRKDKLETIKNMSEVVITIASDSVVSLPMPSDYCCLCAESLQAFSEGTSKEITITVNNECDNNG